LAHNILHGAVHSLVVHSVKHGGLTLGSQTPLILFIGDSQISGRASAHSPADQSNPGFNPLATQSQSVVLYAEDKIAQTFADPPTYDIDVTGGVAPYHVSTPDDLMGIQITAAQEFTRQSVKCVFGSYSIVGLPCKDMVPSPSPAYPTTGPSWYNTMKTYANNLETTQKCQVQVIVISAGNNDGFNSTDSNNLPTNMSLLAAQLVADFPGLKQIIWLKINADTVNFPGFIAGTITNQTTWFTNNPTVSGKPVTPCWFDDQQLQTDHAHLQAPGYMTVGQRVAWMALDALAYTRPRPSSTPQIMGYGPCTADNTTSVPSGWGGAMANDLEVLFSCQMVASGTEGAPSVPTGWTQRATATSANSSPGFQVRLTVFTRTVTSAMLAANHNNPAATSVLLDTPNTVNYNQIVTIRGSNASAAPTLDFIQTSTTNTATTTMTLTGGSATGAGLLITNIFGFTGGALVTCTVTITGTNIVGLTVVKNGTHSTPNAAVSVCDVQAGTVSAGSSGNGSVTLGVSTTQPVGVQVAFKS
jgi:hypothetical protein